MSNMNTRSTPALSRLNCDSEPDDNNSPDSEAPPSIRGRHNTTADHGAAAPLINSPPATPSSPSFLQQKPPRRSARPSAASRAQHVLKQHPLTFVAFGMIFLIFTTIFLLIPLPKFSTVKDLTNAFKLRKSVKEEMVPAYQTNNRNPSDLIDQELQCQGMIIPYECDFSEIDPAKPQDLYSFQAGVHLTKEGPGAVVRIKMRDLCCYTSTLPVSYFRITAHGASQAASNPPLALGSEPATLGRGHHPVYLSANKKLSRDIRLEDIDEERVLQTFLLLPDPGYYEIQVLLLHYNVSTEMISENYQMNSKLYNERPGGWVNDHITNVRGEKGTKLFISNEIATAASSSSRSRISAYTNRKEQIPKCGQEGDDHGKVTNVRSTSRLPLSGRWVYQPSNGENVLADYTSLDKKFLVEHSEWRPYHCQLDQTVSIAKALEKVQWMHFTGDSNTRHMFFYVCEIGNGTLMSVNSENVPRYLDPPFSCIGPSSTENLPDAQTGLKVGSAARWTLTYTNWFWGKHQTLAEDFSFNLQCNKFVEQNKTGLFYGWPGCQVAPEFVQKLSGPGVTYFGWGSHAAEFGANPLTEQYFDTNEAFRQPYFYKHPTIFPLTTANTPSLIPDKFGKQQVMRNNERVHAGNLHLISAVMKEHLNYATRTQGGTSSSRNIIPLFDLFSPTHAAHDLLACDAVHFEKFFSYEEVKYLMHYLYYSPNFGATQN